jgi:DNA-binding Lrp family transcriptional regulator
MAEQKVDYSKLEQLLSENPKVKVRQVADALGISKGTASKALKKLGHAFSKDVASRSIPAIVDKKTSAMDYLLSLVKKAKEDLEWIEKSIPPQVTEDFRLWQEQKMKISGEIRKTITAIGDIAYKFYHAEEVKETLEIIIQEVGCESEDCQKRIRQRIQARRDIRLPFNID